jgi:hypothetical protein
VKIILEKSMFIKYSIKKPLLFNEQRFRTLKKNLAQYRKPKVAHLNYRTYTCKHVFLESIF